MLVHEAVDLTNALLREFNLAGQGWSVALDKSSWHAGLTRFDQKQIVLSVRAIEQYSNDEMEEVILHELGHALVGPGHAHGRTWARQVRELGGTPQERHSSIRGGGLSFGAWGVIASIWYVAFGRGATALIVVSILIVIFLAVHFVKTYGPVRDETYCVTE